MQKLQMFSSSQFANLPAIFNPVNPLLSLSENELRDELRFALRFIAGKPASTPTTMESLIRSKAATEWVRDFMVTLTIPRAFVAVLADKPALWHRGQAILREEWDTLQSEKADLPDDGTHAAPVSISCKSAAPLSESDLNDLKAALTEGSSSGKWVVTKTYGLVAQTKQLIRALEQSIDALECFDSLSLEISRLPFLAAATSREETQPVKREVLRSIYTLMEEVHRAPVPTREGAETLIAQVKGAL